jgi:voltage-gated potassium channel
MKFFMSQIAYFLSERSARQNVRTLAKYVAFLVLLITIYSVLFHVIMLYAESRYHSWLSGFYWTLTVMTTLGFGDITFTSDIGRLFSIVVMLSGIVFLLIVLPFTFIRLFYAPWLEAQVRVQTPREVPPSAARHVIICQYDSIAPGLIERLRFSGIPYYVIEPDWAQAARMHGDGISVIAGDVDSSLTYKNMRVAQARLVFANCSDTVNTNITLTVREVAPEVPIVGLAQEQDSVDILQLSGCSYVMPLHQHLAERLANRVNAGHAQTHSIGRILDLQIADFVVYNTPLVGKTVGELKLEKATGVTLIAVWERGRLNAAKPATVLGKESVVVVAGTAAQMLELDMLLVIYNTNYNPVLIIGGGRVGQAAARALKQREVAFHLVERDARLREHLTGLSEQIFIGDAADRSVLMKAGLNEAPSVLLTTNDDAMNIYLAVYCRRLNPDLRIISRITHEKNIEAIYRAGADFAISYASLGAEEIFAQMHSRQLLILGEGFEIFSARLPRPLVSETIGSSKIAEVTGLNVIGIQQDGKVETHVSPETPLPEGSELVMMGSTVGRQEFFKTFQNGD